MSDVSMEAFLARLYTDAVMRDGFLSDPEATARAAGVRDQDVAALMEIDRAGLCMAAASYERKREQHRRQKTTLGRRLVAGVFAFWRSRWS
mgnify:CR=1 FL=1